MSSSKTWFLALVGGLAVLLAVSWGVRLHAGDSAAGKTAPKAPDISIKTPNGIRRLSDLQGKVVLVDFWATWCGPCRQSIPMVEEMYKRNHSRGFEVIGVALEHGSGYQIPEFVKDMGITYPVGLPADMEEAKSYQPDSIPLMVLVDRKGRIRWRQNGYTSDVDIRLVDQIDRLLKE